MADQTEEEKAVSLLYENQFNPQVYLETYVSEIDDFLQFTIRCLHSVFALDIPSVKTSVLELGCGPTIHSLISASRYFDNIVISDYLTQNRKEITKWLTSDKDAYDWSATFKKVAALENEPDYRKLEDRLRTSVKEVIHCDILKPNPIEPLVRRFDVIVSSLCFEAVATDIDSYKRILTNTSNILNSEGFLVLIGVFEDEYYHVGDVKFPAFPYSKEMLKIALSEAGFELLQLLSSPHREISSEFAKADDIFMALAKKNATTA